MTLPFNPDAVPWRHEVSEPAEAADAWSQREVAADAYESEGQQYTVLDATYVDDEVFVLFGTSPVHLWQNVHLALPIIIEEFEKDGLEINWSPGKTEAILSFRGAGSQGARAFL